MPDDTVEIREAHAANLDRIADLLKANDLPAEDLRTSPARFVLAESDGAVVGAGGVEHYGSEGLLRSVVVAEAARGRGLGTAICDELESTSRGAGVETLYLLTTNAAAFFRDRGYEVIDREGVPDSIHATREFQDLCPASATCMRKETHRSRAAGSLRDGHA